MNAITFIDNGKTQSYTLQQLYDASELGESGWLLDDGSELWPLDFHTAWLNQLKPGYWVWWNDPDGGFSSGRYQIERIDRELGVPFYDDTLIVLRNPAGSCAEVYPGEIAFAQTIQK